MIKAQTRLFPLISAFILGILFCPFLASAYSVAAPTVLSIRSLDPRLARPEITGLTPHNTDVMVYMDGDFVGLAKTKTTGTASDSFIFQSEKTLLSGSHTVSLAARDKVSLILSAPTAREFTVAPLPAPTLVAPNATTVTGRVKPLITGLSASDTRVLVFIDGALNGKTGWLQNRSGTAHFAYRPFLNLSVGEHTVWAVAESRSGEKSAAAAGLSFRIEPPMPAPILFTPVVNSKTSANQPFIVGLAKNDARIKVYIDKVLNGEFTVKNHPSGTANFAYKPFLPLAAGPHMVYAEAVDNRGKASQWSNITHFRAAGAKPQIKDEAVAGKAEEPAAVVPPEQPPAVEPGKPAPIEVAPAEPEEPAATTSERTEIEELIDKATGTTTAVTGLIDESQSGQSRLKLNLIIFIVFLLAVIAWIFWVNRELIKERRAAGDQPKSKDDNQPPLI